nr:hypothetical protein [Tanacetum cinerariifolium]
MGYSSMDAYESDPEAPEAAPQSLDQAPLSPAYSLMYPEYLAPSDDDLEPAEAQPLPASVSPTALSPDYSTDSELVEEDPKEDPEEDPDEDPEEEPTEEEEEEEELLAPADSPSAGLYIDLPSKVEEDEVPFAQPSPTSHHHIIALSYTGLRRARMFEIGESSASVAARQPRSALAQGTDYGFVTHLEEVNKRVTDLATSHRHDSEKMTSTRTSMSQEALEELITQRVADAFATYDTNRSNGDDIHDSGCGRRRTVYTTRECTYIDFLKCQPLNFKGTEGDTLMKMMTEYYYPRCEIKKLETELWNLVVKGTSVERYSQRFQELIMLCSRMFLDESNKVEKYSGGLPDSIQGSKLLTYATRQAENERKMDNNSRNNQDQQPPYKRSPAAVNTQRAPGAVQKTGTCFECGSQGHFKRDFPKLKNQNCENAVGKGEARGRAYALGGGEPYPNSNVVIGTFLLNNHYASILFDTGADRSFVSTTFSSLIDITPSTLDDSYDVELAEKRITGVNTISQGCTLKLLNHPFNIDLMLIELGSFDNIIVMDWLSKYHVVIVYDEKIIRIPYDDEVLIVQGDKSDGRNES